MNAAPIQDTTAVKRDGDSTSETEGEVRQTQRGQSRPLKSAEVASEWLATFVMVVAVAIIHFTGDILFPSSLFVPDYILNLPNITDVLEESGISVVRSGNFSDARVALEFREDTVPDYWLFIFAILFACVASAMVQLCYRCTSQAPAWAWKFDTHFLFISVFQTLALVLLFTECIKIAAGRFRPDFYDRLILVSQGKLDAGEVKDGMSSYISGHSSVSFGTMAVLILYLCGKLRLFTSRTDDSVDSLTLLKSSKFFKLIAVLVPFLGFAIFVALTRILDHKHNFSDVNAGAALGSLLGSMVYFLHFRSLFDDSCDFPRGVYSKREG